MLEPVEKINIRLKDKYGRFETTNHSMYRVVYSEDELEKRLTHYTHEGFALLTPEVKELPKYRQWVQNKYILERLTVVPEFVESDLIHSYSYEPIWVFEDKNGNPLPPKWEAIEMIIDQLHRQAARAVGVKYKDPDVGDTLEETLDIKKRKIEALAENLFGNETNTGDALAYKEGVVVPRNFEKGLV